MKQSLPATAANTPREPLVIPVRLGLIGPDGSEAAVNIRGDGGGKTETEAIVVLDDSEKTVTLENVAAGSVPSILRGFSAPVEMTDDLDDAARLHLLAHDGDAFGRWDAGQGLMRDAVLGLVNGDDDGASRMEKISVALAATINDSRLDGAEKAQILRIPSQVTLEAMMDEPDPVLICTMRREFAKALGHNMHDAIAERLGSLREQNTELDAPSRALYVRLLGLAVGAGNDGAESHALELSGHGNMTLAEGGLAALNQTDSTARTTALDAFAKKWEGNSLVMEKWFALEASAPDISTPEHCKKLMQHKAFDAGNPNKLRSVLSVFANANPLNFHAADGSGYEFIARHVADIDRRNPQLAARLALPLSRFASYGKDRQTAMRGALAEIKSGQEISPDLAEVITRALGG